MTTKFCHICQQTKDRQSFPKRTKTKDGLDTYCKSCNTAKSKEWNSKNRERRRDINKAYSEKNRDKVLSDMRKWYANNRSRAIRNVSNRIKEREKVDINFKLSRILRSRLCSAIKRHAKSGSAVNDLGCSIEELKKHLESKFQPGMTWDNYGEWHIDHIKPLCLFDLTDAEELKKACNYTNLQPLWRQQNLDKRRTDGTFKE